MRLSQVRGALGAIGLIATLGACEVEVNKGPVQPMGPIAQGGGPGPAHPESHPAAPAPVHQGAAPKVAGVKTATPSVAPPPTPSPAPAPAPGPSPSAAGWGHMVITPQQPTPNPQFPLRIIHPPPSNNTPSGTLDVAALRAKLQPGRKCGPREVSPTIWVHIDCNKYKPLTKVVAFSPRKLNLMTKGKLRMDSAVNGSLPDSVDHRNDGTEGPIKDQGSVGSCTSFSLSSAMDNAIRRQNKQDTMSSLHIWSHYGTPDMGAAGDGNVGKPIATWAQWPYDERLACELDTMPDCGPYSPPTGDPGSDKTLQADIKKADGEGAWTITEYDSLPADANTIAGVLATGADVWFAMEIGESWMSPNGDQIADWTQDSIAGGHAILFAGYRHKNGKRQFLVHNSWGQGWGDHGFAWINESMMTPDFLVGAWKVVVAAGRVAPNPPQPPPPGPIPPWKPAPPQPNPPPQPPPSPPSPDPNALTDDDCGETQLVDSVTGQCAQMCPDDSRPAGGKCNGGVGGGHK